MKVRDKFAQLSEVEKQTVIGGWVAAMMMLGRVDEMWEIAGVVLNLRRKDPMSLVEPGIKLGEKILGTHMPNLRDFFSTANLDDLASDPSQN